MVGRPPLRAGMLVVPALLLAACGKADSDAGPGGVTVGEARALDQAAEMLDKQRLPAISQTGETARPSGSPSPQDNAGR